MTFYSDMQNASLSLLRQFGQSGTLRQTTSSYDPSTGEAILSPVDTAVTVAVLPLPRGKDEFAPELIEASTNIVMMSANEIQAAGITITPNDKVVIGGTVFDITDLTPIAPAGVVVVYKMFVAK